MWWKPILFCVITDGPTSSKCDLTLMTSATLLRSSISWNRIDHKSPLGPCSRSPPCTMPFVAYFASIGIWMFDFSSTRLRIWMAPHSSALGTVCLPRTWPPKKPVRANLKDVSLSGCNEKVATPTAACLTDLGVSRLPPEPSEAIKSIRCHWHPPWNRCFPTF